MNTTSISKIVSNSIVPETILIEGGSFMMGSNESTNEQPIHKVKVFDFHLGKYPITVKQYMSFVKDTQSNAPEWVEEGSAYNIYTGSDNHYKQIESVLILKNCPIIGISWLNAQAYCKWLSGKTNHTYRLPNEAEWEYAARGGKYNQGCSYAGSNKPKEVAWYIDNSHNEPKPVGMKAPNELGLYDMSGNVFEWCEDHWHGSYNEAPKDGSAWRDDEENERRVVRGGSWDFNDVSCRVSFRDWYYHNYRINYVGFRIARY